MPKYNFYIEPGEHLPEEVIKIIGNYFSNKDIEKLKKCGGRVQISLTAPYTDRKKQKKNIVINYDLISLMRSSRQKAETQLSQMTLKQIKEVAKYLNFPIASNTNVGDARKQLISYLFSGDTWKGISG